MKKTLNILSILFLGILVFNTFFRNRAEADVKESYAKISEGKAIIIDVREESEVLDQDKRCAFECFFRMNRAVGFNVDQKFLIVGLLLHAGVLYAILYVLDGRENSIDWNESKDLLIGLIFLSGQIATPFLS